MAFFSSFRTLFADPPLLQTEAAECGLACLAMVARHHGYRTDLPSLRQRFSLSLKGATLAQLIDYAAALELASRPLKLKLEELPQLQRPAILHWNLNHFVVLVAADQRGITIHDPARGERWLSYADASPHFTGVALELTPTPAFRPAVASRRVRIAELWGRVTGLKRGLAQILLLALALEAFALLSPFFMQWTVDKAIVAADRDLILVLALGFLLLLLVQAAIGLARGWMVLFLSTQLGLQWAGRVFAHLLSLPIPYFEKRHLGDIASRFNAVQTIQKAVTTSFVEAVLDGLLALLTLGMMLLYSPRLAGVVVAAVLLYALLRWAAYQPLRTASEESLVLHAKEHSHWLETVRGISSIRLYGRERDRQSRWVNLLVDAVNRDVRTEKLVLAYRSANTLLFGIENLVVVALAAALVLDQVFTVGMLFAFVAYKTQFTTRVSGLIDKWIELQMLGLQAERLADIVLAEPEPAAPALVDLSHLPPTLELRNLSFRYGDGEPWVLRDLNLAIVPGEAVAIVGASGCGKSTLLKILLGLLPPSSGEVLYGGIPVARLGYANFRRLVGTVMQDDQLFAGAIADNIAFFDPQPDQARIEHCAALAAVHDDISRMPMGYFTLIGDMGAALSGGQKQRVLLARALYRQPRLLMLDEATSHLDVERERAVNSAIRELPLTRVIVAHRPETIASADRVVVLDGGLIVADHRRPGSEAVVSDGQATSPDAVAA